MSISCKNRKPHRRASISELFDWLHWTYPAFLLQGRLSMSSGPQHPCTHVSVGSTARPAGCTTSATVGRQAKTMKHFLIFH